MKTSLLRQKGLSFFAILWCLCAPSFPSTDLVVPRDVANIKAAIAKTQEGGRVLLEGGVFNESVVIEKSVTLAPFGNGVPILRPGEEHFVLKVNDESGSNPLTVEIDGLRIENGSPGLLLEAPLASVFVRHSYFFRNANERDSGGAILGEQFNLLHVFDSDFVENTASAVGGAISLESLDSHVEILSSRFVKNQAEEEGGAIYLNRVLRSVFHDNTFDQSFTYLRGGAICMLSPWESHEFVGNTFTRNAADTGAAVYLRAQGGSFFSNHFLENNGFDIEEALFVQSYLFYGSPELIGSSVFLVDNNRFLNNTGSGARIQSDATGRTIVTNNDFIGNEKGLRLSSHDSNVFVSKNRFLDQTRGSGLELRTFGNGRMYQLGGGSFPVPQSFWEVSANLFRGNENLHDFGAAFTFWNYNTHPAGSRLRVFRNTMIGNRSLHGLVFSSDNPVRREVQVEFTNNTVLGNSAREEYLGAVSGSRLDLFVVNSVVRYNEGTTSDFRRRLPGFLQVDSSEVEWVDQNRGAGNFTLSLSEAGYRSLDLENVQAADLHLTAASLLRNRGSDLPAHLIHFDDWDGDFVGVHNFDSVKADVGADEFNPLSGGVFDERGQIHPLLSVNGNTNKSQRLSLSAPFKVFLESLVHQEKTPYVLYLWRGAPDPSRYLDLGPLGTLARRFALFGGNPKLVWNTFGRIGQLGRSCGHCNAAQAPTVVEETDQLPGAPIGTRFTIQGVAFDSTHPERSSVTNGIVLEVVP